MGWCWYVKLLIVVVLLLTFIVQIEAMVLRRNFSRVKMKGDVKERRVINGVWMTCKC